MQNPYSEDLLQIFIFWLLSLCPLLARLPSVCNTWSSPVAMRWFSSTSGFAVVVLKVITFFSWKQIVWVTDHSKLSGLSTYSTEMCKGIIPKRMLIVALSYQQNDRTHISIWWRTYSNAWYLYEGKHAIDPYGNMLKFTPLLIKLSKSQNSVSVCIKCSNVKALFIF